ncbi:MAG: asparagine synthase (glutamine-hydrolyzing) [Legionellales bacterium]|nr:asparagine synthase (glutamine-hydrolyzing) [Legionellales bacterium]
MCGISGVFSSCKKDEHLMLINSIVEHQSNRGPDHQGIEVIKFEQGQTIFGHNRLSILDLDARSNQPMWDNSKRYCITYNGEIYNYLELRDILLKIGFNFKTKSDTEVILNAFYAWKEQAFKKFNGAFSFGLFDKLENVLWLVRDRFGKKPLYYWSSSSEIVFASTAKKIAQYVHASPNFDYIAHGIKYLVFENGSEETQYNNIKSVIPGSYVRCLKNNGLKLENKYYYDLKKNVPTLVDKISSYSLLQHSESILELLQDSVKIRLRSDVPVGISLSGGLDSSVIASLTVAQKNNITAFCYGSPDQKHSEGVEVNKLSKKLNLNVNYIWPSNQEIIDGLLNTIKLQDAPFSSLSVVMQQLIYKHVKNSGIKVLMGGQGGDEAFMGYRKYLLFKFKNLIYQKNYFGIIKHFIDCIPIFFSEYKQFPLYWRHRDRYNLVNDIDDTIINLPHSSILSLNYCPSQPLYERQILDIIKLSLPTLLRYEDCNSLGNSVESRLPFMDYRLIEYGLALETKFKIRSGYGKWIVREIMSDKLIPSICWARYKRGFDISLSNLINTGLGNILRKELFDKECEYKSFLKNNISIKSAFSDMQLISNKKRIMEAITLLWLSQ